MCSKVLCVIDMFPNPRQGPMNDRLSLFHADDWAGEV